MPSRMASALWAFNSPARGSSACSAPNPPLKAPILYPASTLDVLILVPVIPLVFILVTCWLPWERWLSWDELPNRILGPYLLYAAFAAWHVKLPWWSAGLL